MHEREPALADAWARVWGSGSPSKSNSEALARAAELESEAVLDFRRSVGARPFVEAWDEVAALREAGVFQLFGAWSHALAEDIQAADPARQAQAAQWIVRAPDSFFSAAQPGEAPWDAVRDGPSFHTWSKQRSVSQRAIAFLLTLDAKPAAQEGPRKAGAASSRSRPLRAKGWPPEKAWAGRMAQLARLAMRMPGQKQEESGGESPWKENGPNPGAWSTGDVKTHLEAWFNANPHAAEFGRAARDAVQSAHSPEIRALANAISRRAGCFHADNLFALLGLGLPARPILCALKKRAGEPGMESLLEQTRLRVWGSLREDAIEAWASIAPSHAAPPGQGKGVLGADSSLWASIAESLTQGEADREIFAPIFAGARVDPGSMESWNAEWTAMAIHEWLIGAVGGQSIALAQMERLWAKVEARMIQATAFGGSQSRSPRSKTQSGKQEARQAMPARRPRRV